MTKKIAVVGVGGRTGTLFAYEMRNSAQILGVARRAQMDDIKDGKSLLQSKGASRQDLNVKSLKKTHSPRKLPRILFF